MLRAAGVPHLLRGLVCIVGFLTLGACQGEHPTGESPSLGLEPGFDILPVYHDDSASTVLSIERRGGFAGEVSLAVEGAPSGLVAGVTPSIVGAGATQAVLRIAASSAVAPGSYPVHVRATGTGVAGLDAVVTVIVRAGFTLSLAPITVGQAHIDTTSIGIVRTGPSVGSILLFLDSVPFPGGGAFFPNPADGSSAEFRFGVPGAVYPGTAKIRVGGRAENGLVRYVRAAVNIVAVPDFSLLPMPSFVGTLPGRSVTLNAAIGRRVAFTAPVSFSATGLPDGITVSFDPVVADGDVTRIEVFVAASVVAGRYEGTIEGRADTLLRTMPLVVAVDPPPDFSLAVSPEPPIALPRGQTTTVLIDILRHAFADPVLVTLSGLPSGVGVTYTYAGDPATSSLVIADLDASPSTVPGTYTVTATGTGGGKTHSISFAINVL